MEFYKDKRVLVTGHTGYKGAWLTKILKKLGAKVYGFSLQPNDDSLYARLESCCVKSYIHDIRDITSLRQCFLEVNPEIVFHLAAQAYIDLNNPINTYTTNVIGLVNILEVIRETKSVVSVVVVTSDKCYRNKEDSVSYYETCELGAADPYSTSKACQELVVESYIKTYFVDSNVRVATARASNVIGGGDFNKTRLIPYIVDCFLNGNTAELRNINAVRPWQNILDVLYGYLLLAKSLYDDKSCIGAFNFGSRQESFVTVGEVVKMFMKHFENASYALVQSNNNVEAQILKLDSSKAQEKLCWMQKLTLEDNVKMTTEFYKDVYNGKKIDYVCDYYINKFFK